MTLKCPKCHNDDVKMLETYGHRREQMNINCTLCGHSFVHVFEGIPKDNTIKIPIKEPLRWT